MSNDTTVGRVVQHRDGTPPADRSGRGSPAMNGTRPAFFANRVLRLATKTTLAQHLGSDVLTLLCVIAMTEDARRYRGPVAFYNDQLLPLVGFAKWDRLEKARRKAIDAGWLSHEPGGRHRPGLYRVTIPKELESVEDAPVDEGPTPGEGYQAGYEAGYRAGFEAGSSSISLSGCREGERAGDQQGELGGEREGEPSCPVPVPKTSTSTKDNAASKRELEAVEVLLSEAGIGTATPTARDVVERGYTANHVGELLDFARKHAAGFRDWRKALVFRLKNSPPATPVDQGWPPSNEKPRSGADTRLETLFGSRLSLMKYPPLRELALRAGIANAAKMSDDELSVLRAANTTNRRKLIEQLAREHSAREQDDKPP